MTDGALTARDGAPGSGTVTSEEGPAPHTIGEIAQPVRRPPAHRHHATLGAHFRIEGGWEIPMDYGDGTTERDALRDSVGVGDVTARAKVDLRGDILAFLSRLAGSAPAPGSTVRFASNPAPGLIATVSDRWALVLDPPETQATHMARLEADAPPSVMVTDAASLYAGFAVAGPGAHGLVARVSGFDLSALPPGCCAATRALEVTALVLHRDLPTTVVEVYFGSEFGRYAWEGLLEAGRGLGAAPVGWDALRAEGWW